MNLLTSLGFRLNPFSFIHQRLERGINKPEVRIHTDVTRAQMKKDSDVVNAIVGWLDEVDPFNSVLDRKTLVSFSTGFSSTPGDSVNADKAEEIGRAMQAKMDGKTVLDVMEIKHKVVIDNPQIWTHCEWKEAGH